MSPRSGGGSTTTAGIIFAEPLVEGLRRAGRNLTVDTLVKAMETLNGWQGIGMPLTFTATERQGGKHVFLPR